MPIYFINLLPTLLLYISILLLHDSWAHAEVCAACVCVCVYVMLMRVAATVCVFVFVCVFVYMYIRV